MSDRDVQLILIAWERVVEAAGSKAVLSGRRNVSADRRDVLAIALGSLRAVIRNIPEAEAQIQRRLRWVDEHAGPGTPFHEQLKAVVVALAPARNFNNVERRAYCQLRSAAANDDEQGKYLGYRTVKRYKNGEYKDYRVEVIGASIDSLDQLLTIEDALERLTRRVKARDLISSAMTMTDQLIKQATADEVKAAIAFVTTDEMARGGRVSAIGETGIVDSVHLGAIGRLVQQIVLALSPKTSLDKYNGAESVERMKAEKKLREDFRVILSPPSVIVESTPYPLEEREALYLETLMKSLGEWMTDGEFRKLRPEVGETARPDLWRKNLPTEVRNWLETHRSKGTRIRRPQ